MSEASVSTHNHDAIARRGGFLCGNDDFCFYKCDTCGCLALVNEEVEQIYVNSADMSCPVFYFDDVDVVCPACKSVNSFSSTTALDRDAILKSSWKWLFEADA